MSTYGLMESYYARARREGILFIKYDPEEKPEVTKNGDRLSVAFVDRILKEKIAVEPDHEGDGETITVLCDFRFFFGVILDEENPFSAGPGIIGFHKPVRPHIAIQDVDPGVWIECFDLQCILHCVGAAGSAAVRSLCIPRSNTLDHANLICANHVVRMVDDPIFQIKLGDNPRV